MHYIITGISDLRLLLSIESRESFLKGQDVWWIYEPCQKWWGFLLPSNRFFMPGRVSYAIGLKKRY
jgi:hypothetical protein